MNERGADRVLRKFAATGGRKIGKFPWWRRLIVGGVYDAASGGAQESRKMKPGWNVSGLGRFRGSWVLVAMLVACPAQSADAPAKTEAQPQAAGAPPKTESQLQAAAVLRSMAEYLAALKAFSCTGVASYETVQKDGQRTEFGEKRRISLARPDRLRIDEVDSDGASDLTLFDGKQITALSAANKVYAQAPQPPNLEDALVYFVRDLRMRMPLALLLSTHVRTELPALAKEIDYVETTQIRGQAAHHIAGRGESVDFQFWIAEGTKPLPLRIVITYKQAPGQPNFAADVTDWNIAPKFSANTFQLSLPTDARK